MTIYQDYASVVSYDITTEKYEALERHRFALNDHKCDIHRHILFSSFTLAEHESAQAALRFEHSATLYNDQIYIYGGYLPDMKTISNKLFAYNTTARQWIEQKLPCGLLAVAGHSAHLVNGNILYILLGYNSDRGYMNNVQIIDLKEMTCRTLLSSLDFTFDQQPQPMIGLYKHSSVYDEHTQRIYVYGGISSRVDRHSNILSNTLFAFDVVKEKW